MQRIFVLSRNNIVEWNSITIKDPITIQILFYFVHKQ